MSIEQQTAGKGAVVGGMKASGVRHPPGRTGHTVGPGFDLITGKLRRPAVPTGTVPRSQLLDRVARGDSPQIVSVVAPSGYGKTTLLAQWAACDVRPFAWVSLDERDNDPKVLLSYVAAALDAVQPVGGRVLQALASPSSSVPGSVVPRLASAFLSMTAPRFSCPAYRQISGDVDLPQARRLVASPGGHPVS
jgi:LuxR family transcriptional regulator, maltose regulon positive regulatory protein